MMVAILGSECSDKGHLVARGPREYRANRQVCLATRGSGCPEVLEEDGSPDPEEPRGEPVLAELVPDELEVRQGLLPGPDATGHLHPDETARPLPEGAHGACHGPNGLQRDRSGLPGRRLHE